MTKAKRECRYLIRFEATASNIVQMKNKLLAMGDPSLNPRIEKLESGMSRADRLAFAIGMLQDALGDIEGLHDEMESWGDGIPENLQSGSKADEVNECKDALCSVKDQIDSAISEGENVSFPGMF